MSNFNNSDFTDNEMLIVPININNGHWCFVIIDLIENEIIYCDTLPNVFDVYSDQHIENIATALSNSLLTKDKQFCIKTAETPKQNNLMDSGVFVCQLINYYSINREIDFDTNDIPYLRYIMGIEIIKGAVLLS